MKKLLYIHGYRSSSARLQGKNGSPEGSSCRLFRKYIPQDKWQVIGMDYTQDDCAVALREISETIEREKIDLVVGSSLGGFLTLLTTGIERIVINPCDSPSVELPKLGPHNGLPAPSKEMIATYAAFEPQLKKFSPEEKKLIKGYFADDDELLEDRYQGAYMKDIGGIWIIPGGHHLSEEAAKDICYRFTDEYEYLRNAHRASFKNEEQILSSKQCGCFACKRLFPASEAELVPEPDGKRTAWCPHCNTDSVLGDASGYPITTQFLQRMHDEWFG